jgi:6-phosphogluconolactonase
MVSLSSSLTAILGGALVCATSLLGGGNPAMSVANSSAAVAAAPTSLLVYVGTYTQKGNSKGIYIYKMDMETGNLTEAGVGPMVASPSFLAIHPNHRFLYAVNELESYQGAKSGSVSSFAIDPKTGGLTLLNQQPSGGGAPCHIVVDKGGKNVLIANYTGGSVAVLPIMLDGSLAKTTSFIQHTGSSVDPARQEGPHAHSINLNASNQLAFVPDLGTDKVVIYKYDSIKGALTPNDPPAGIVAPGSGPRHFEIHRNGRFAYVINEMKSTVTAFNYDAKTGALTEIQNISTLPADFHGNSSTAEVQISPSGKFLYGSNRGHDSIAIFSIDQKTGKLTLIGHQSTLGKTPRNFYIEPSGTYMLAANQDSDNIFVFKVDQQTGKLTPTGQEVSVPMPVAITTMPFGK